MPSVPHGVTWIEVTELRNEGVEAGDGCQLGAAGSRESVEADAESRHVVGFGVEAFYAGGIEGVP